MGSIRTLDDAAREIEKLKRMVSWGDTKLFTQERLDAIQLACPKIAYNIDRGILQVWTGTEWVDGASGSSFEISVVENYSALPPANENVGEFFWVENNEGTYWLPGNVGGTFRQRGLYYSNSVSWIYTETPYQGSQPEVDAGTNNTKFVTPLTLKNASQWATKADTIHSHFKSEIIDFDDDDYATAAQGVKADTALQSADLAPYETTTQLNNRDTANRNRSNHTGTQSASTISDFNASVDALITGKQNVLVSGTNIKTINGETLLGSGDVVISVSGYSNIDGGNSSSIFGGTPIVDGGNSLGI